jgi:RNA-directed DNA polymerase
MRTEKSRLRRSLLSLEELMRHVRHDRIGDQVGEINAALRGHYAYYGVAGNIRALFKMYRPRSVTGTGCCVVAVGPQVA